MGLGCHTAVDWLADPPPTPSHSYTTHPQLVGDGAGDQLPHDDVKLLAAGVIARAAERPHAREEERTLPEEMTSPSDFTLPRAAAEAAGPAFEQQDADYADAGDRRGAIGPHSQPSRRRDTGSHAVPSRATPLSSR